MSQAHAVFEPASSAFPELRCFIRSDASESLAQLLSDNHSRHHCFFNTRGMHNHSAHQLIADLTLGADPNQLDVHYRYQIQHYLGKFSMSDRRRYDPYVGSTNKSDKGGGRIEKIDGENWTEHLGNARYYWSYLHFFDSVLREQEVAQVVEKYIFSTEANQDGRRMMVRFYGGVLHSLIHVGYGLELGLNALVAEGLAMATATAASHAWLFDFEWLSNPPRETGGDGKVGLLELVKELQEDGRATPEALKLAEQDASLPDEPFETPNAPGYGLIQSYVDRWSANQAGTTAAEEQALGELALFSALLLGAVPKQSDGTAYKHDFFLMHLNNTHLFTPLFLSLLPTENLRLTFLRGLLAQFLYYYISRGRPRFTHSHFDTEHTHSHQVKHPNNWRTMFDLARQNVDEHLPKAVRALYIYHSRYSEFETQLVGSKLLDRSLEYEIAKENTRRWEGTTVFELTAQQLVRMHMGQLQQSRYDTDETREQGESIGAHQEFWSFDPFF